MISGTTQHIFPIGVLTMGGPQSGLLLCQPRRVTSNQSTLVLLLHYLYLLAPGGAWLGLSNRIETMDERKAKETKYLFGTQEADKDDHYAG